MSMSMTRCNQTQKEATLLIFLLISFLTPKANTMFRMWNVRTMYETGKVGRLQWKCNGDAMKGLYQNKVTSSLTAIQRPGF